MGGRVELDKDMKALGTGLWRSGRPATFHWLRGLAFAPDGTLYLRDEHLVRKLDSAGQVSTWRSDRSKQHYRRAG